MIFEAMKSEFLYDIRHLQLTQWFEALMSLVSPIEKEVAGVWQYQNILFILIKSMAIRTADKERHRSVSL